LPEVVVRDPHPLPVVHAGITNCSGITRHGCHSIFRNFFRL
jgi:hypothetical protein